MLIDLNSRSKYKKNGLNFYYAINNKFISKKKLDRISKPIRC